MDKTESTVRVMLTAIEAPLYDVGVLSERGMLPRLDGISAAAILDRLSLLKYRNAHGSHIYIRPSGEHRFTTLDDLNEASLARLSADGFNPCAVIETSAGNFQAWLMHSRIFPKLLGSFAAQTLAGRYDADPSAADWRRFGRLPGFTNCKPKYRKPDGLFPFVRLHSHSGQQYPMAEAFEIEITTLYKAREQENEAKRLQSSLSPQRARRLSNLSLERFRTSIKYQDRPAAADIAFQRLLDLPGYDVATLVEKSGKSASHIYARLSLLQLIPEVADAFTQERITASHANLIARLPQESQAEAFEQCWRKDWQDSEPHLLPAKHVSAWIQNNLYLSLADAPFDREDPTLNPAAGACVTCPRRSGYNTSLFSDVTDGDQCLSGPCYQIKITAHIDREIAACPELIQIENGWRSARGQRPGAVQRGHFREIETVEENPDAEPAPPCAAAKPAIIVYGKRVGTTITVCTDDHCPVHDPNAAAEEAANPAPTMAPAPEVETEEEAEERQRNYEQQRKEYEQEQERKAEERKQQFEREQKEHEAERARREKLHKARLSKFDRILAKAPAMFSAAQLRMFLRALVNIDPYTFDDVAEQLAANDENNQQTSEEILLSTIDGLPDDKLTGFALRLVITAHIPIPREGELDYLAEAETAFAPLQPKKAASRKTTTTPTPIKAAKKTTAKKLTAKKEVAA